METGTHCRWISSLAKHCGCDAIVGNASKLHTIWENSQKNDWKDAQMIASIARTSRECCASFHFSADRIGVKTMFRKSQPLWSPWRTKGPGAFTSQSIAPPVTPTTGRPSTVFTPFRKIVQ